MFIEVNNVKLFYEKIGSGHPLLLLHGNGEDHTIFNVLVKSLSKQYTCYLIDTRGHGKSSKVSDYHYDDMMEDVYQFITALSLEKPYLLGFSDGGIVGLLLAYRYPYIINKYIICGANLYPQGIKDKELLKMHIQYFFTRNTKLKLILSEPNITLNDLLKIEALIVIISGSKDLIKTSHTNEIVSGIRNVNQIVMEGYNHTSYIINNDILKEIVINFLK